MLAEFASVLGSLKSYEQGHFSGIKIDFNSGCYLDPSHGPNWWEYYFEPINVGNSDVSVIQHCTFDQYMHLAHIGFGLARQEAFKLIQTYIRLKPAIEEEVRSFIKNKFKDHYVIGLHFRGTDKILEHPRISYEKAYSSLQTVINNVSRKNGPLYSLGRKTKKLKVYVATDEQQFMKYLQERIPYC